ncbi:MAG TPA: thiol reductase thioredoxin [Thermoanaerobaculia bacterium]|nr:thiol reductase thioredoxin [Thermoanaerobaculia bacterium]
MRAYVYTDKSLERYAGRFVWLSINTEDAKNAAFLKKYPIPALPTLLVLDPQGAVTMRYVGGATVPHLSRLLDESPRPKVDADKLLVTADRLASDAKHADAAKAYDSAIASAPKPWSKLGRAAESLTFSLAMANEDERCATRALELYSSVKGTVSSANVAATGLSCAAGLDEKHPKRNELVTALENATLEVFRNPKIELSDDDRSGLYLALIDAREAMNDEKRKTKLQHEWAAFLDDAAARAKTLAQRMVYDSHRLSASIVIGAPEKAIPMLELSERDAPDDYNPPARLALAYKAMKEYDKALAASDRALAKVYGPRKILVLTTRADIYLAKGDAKAAKETIAQAVEYAKSLPPGQRSEARIAGLEKRLASM